ncbi:MAG: hypothetical protein N2257_01705 [Thermodesulfovibrionales bacterium]|nr:hypothetical protein [Thermodesulfovibrionales bacterium]
MFGPEINFCKVKETLGRKVNNEEILESVTNAIKPVFREINAFFDNLSKTNFLKMVDGLTANQLPEVLLRI